MKYYFLGILLPELSFDTPPDITFAQLDDLLRLNLNSKDYQATKKLRELYDVLNLRSLWLNENLDPRGELQRSALEEALIVRSGLPDYIYAFMDKYEKTADRIRHFPLLLAHYFREAAQSTSGFLKEYFLFEREWRLVFTAFRAKKLRRDITIELQYEDPEEDIIVQILAQRDAKTYEPPERYEDLKIIFEKYGNEPLALEKALDSYRVDRIKQFIADEDPFSIQSLLAYIAQFIIIQKWFELDKNKGNQIVDTIVKGQS